MITDVFFDLDHTLWDFEKNSALAFQRILAEEGFNVTIDNFLSYYVPINHEYWSNFSKGNVTQQELRIGRLKDTFKALQIDVSLEKLTYLSERYIEVLPSNNHLFNGVKEILEYLKSKYKLHILTNGFAEVQTNKLINSNIADYFLTVTNSESAGYKKPQPEIFEYALNLAKTNASSSIMIGDSLEADVFGAINVGMQAIFFNEQKQIVPNNVISVNNLIDLKNYL